MTPEEKFNREIWFVLQKIKEASFRTSPLEFIEYVVKFSGYKPSDAPEPENEVRVLKKIEEWEAIKILNENKHPIAYDIQAIVFHLITPSPKFENLYKKYEQTFYNNSKRASSVSATEYLETIKVIAETGAWLDKIKKEQGIEDKKEIQSQQNSQILTAANKKKLCVLEKLKEEWDLLSKKNNGAVVIDFSWQRNIQLQEGCGIDESQLENILQGFKDEDLLDGFQFFRETAINPAL